MSRNFAHYCHDGHQQIGHNDSEHEVCPMCRLLSENEDLRARLDPFTLCLACKSPRYMHRPQSVAHHSECTLEQFIVDPVSAEEHEGKSPAYREAPSRSGFYVASRASIPERSAMWRAHRASGMAINSTWIDEAGEGETGDFTELWSRIEAEIRRSCGLILYVEPEDFPLKGALIEAGIAVGAGIPVCVVANVLLDPRSCRPVGSWVKHPLVSSECMSAREAIRLAMKAERDAKSPVAPRSAFTEGENAQ